MLIYLTQVDNLLSFEIISKLSNMPNLNSSDLDENFIQTISSKYYKTHDLPKISNHHHVKDFSLFHVNIRSLSKHFDELHTLLYASKIPFDIIGITVSKQSLNKDFLTNAKINDYQLHTQPSKSSCGGIAMYVKKSMVAQCYQACFCSLNTIFIPKFNSNSVLNHNFTFKLVLIFNSVVKFNFNFNHKINSKVEMFL